MTFICVTPEVQNENLLFNKGLVLLEEVKRIYLTHYNQALSSKEINNNLIRHHVIPSNIRTPVFSRLQTRT